MFEKEIIPGDLYYGFYTRIYDYMVGGVNSDLRIYRDLLENRKEKSVCEFACGSGRLLLEIAKSNGVEITGIDLSADMLEILRERIAFHPLEIEKRIELVQGDMTTIKLGKKFDMIFLGACSICLLHSRSQILSFFANVLTHLKRNGIFVFDYQIPDFDWIKANDGKINFIPVNNSYPKHFMLIGEKYFIDRRYSILNFYNELVEADGMTKRHLGATRKAIVDGEEIEQLIVQSNLEITDTVTVRSEPDTCIKGIRYVICRPGN
ncbi:MAG: class I SAM-dependent methyltransferase [Spirochaetales bacterium]|nr:class I SAM-dependent methyltransferase [Spirochaetales bacterium]